MSTHAGESAGTRAIGQAPRVRGVNADVLPPRGSPRTPRYGSRRLKLWKSLNQIAPKAHDPVLKIELPLAVWSGPVGELALDFRDSSRQEGVPLAEGHDPLEAQEIELGRRFPTSLDGGPKCGDGNFPWVLHALRSLYAGSMLSGLRTWRLDRAVPLPQISRKSDGTLEGSEELAPGPRGVVAAHSARSRSRPHSSHRSTRPGKLWTASVRAPACRTVIPPVRRPARQLRRACSRTWRQAVR